MAQMFLPNPVLASGAAEDALSFYPELFVAIILFSCCVLIIKNLDKKLSEVNNFIRLFSISLVLMLVSFIVLIIEEIARLEELIYPELVFEALSAVSAIIITMAALSVKKIFTNYKNKTRELEDLNKNLADAQRELTKKNELIKEGNKKLEATLEDFYTLRLDMESQIKGSELKEENKKIKNKLDELKNKID